MYAIRSYYVPGCRRAAVRSARRAGLFLEAPGTRSGLKFRPGNPAGEWNRETESAGRDGWRRKGGWGSRRSRNRGSRSGNGARPGTHGSHPGPRAGPGFGKTWPASVECCLALRAGRRPSARSPSGRDPTCRLPCPSDQRSSARECAASNSYNFV